MAGSTVAVAAWRLWRGLAAANEERDEALRQAQVLSDAARQLNSTLDPEQVIAVAVRLAAEVASPPGARGRRANYCRITDGMVQLTAESDEEGQWLGARWPVSEHPHLERAVRTLAPTRGGLEPALLGPALREVNRSQDVGHGAWVPVTVDGQLHGVLAVGGRNRPVSERELARCVAIVQIMELALGNALAHERLQRVALTDPLTSLANRRGLEQLVRERCHPGTMTVLALDLDGLKAVNDRYGHVAGDGLILAVADSIRSVARAGDVVARVGGDEFVCVAFDAGEHEAGGVAARILEEIGSVRYRDLSPAVSIGVASASPGVSLDTALQRADSAMYAAKRAGGMRYQLASRAQVAAAE
ncbi:MAG TPA: GGDEF domain-containing protein [Baekduia sp.]|nr:GGDEF domain-containing protein [Baekduia sp.]